MSVIERIEIEAVKYTESGLECPDFVMVSTDVYKKLLSEVNSKSLNSNPSMGNNIITIYTSVAILKVRVYSWLSNNSIIIGENPILTIIHNLGVVLNNYY